MAVDDLELLERVFAEMATREQVRVFLDKLGPLSFEAKPAEVVVGCMIMIAYSTKFCGDVLSRQNIEDMFSIALDHGEGSHDAVAAAREKIPGMVDEVNAILKGGTRGAR